MVRRYLHRPNPASQTQGRVSQASIDNLSLDFDAFKSTAAEDEKVEIRTRWRALVDRDLPKAADSHRDWPVYLNHCFARILLDNAVGQYWRDVIKSPAWNPPLPVLQTAIDLGETILADDADIWSLNDVSLKMRGKALRGRKAAVRRRRRTAAQWRKR
jgi:hypothetical protein